MTTTLVFLILGVLTGIATVLLDRAASRDPEPGVSGYVPLVAIFFFASFFSFLIAGTSWVASITMAVL